MRQRGLLAPEQFVPDPEKAEPMDDRNNADVVTKELYASPNGDRWFFIFDPKQGHAFIRHQANAAAGGGRSDIEIDAFLGRGERNPEHQALLRLLCRSAAAREDA